MALNQYHRTLQALPEFKEMLAQLKKKCPSVHPYDYQADNVRQIVYETALKQGFELAIAHLESSK